MRGAKNRYQWPVPLWHGRSTLSLATALLYLLAATGLFASGALHDSRRNPSWVLLSLGVLAFAFAVWAVVRGRAFTSLEATLMLVAQAAGMVGLSINTGLDLGAFCNGVSEPLVAIYAGWLLSRRAVLLVYVTALAWAVVLISRGDSFLSASGLAVVVETVISAEIVRAFRIRVRELTNVDRLTHVLNRHGLEEVGEALIDEAKRRSSALSLAVVDLDGLRETNNAHGHAAGDALLLAAAGEWVEALSGRTRVGRLGGDEFVLLFQGLTDHDARRKVAEMRANSQTSWTAGVTSFLPGDTFATMLERADAEMYVGKRQRTDRTVSRVAPTDTPRKARSAHA